MPPTEVVILDEKGDRIENGSIVGPMQERQTLKATCTVKNTRPQPDVGWWRGTKRLATCEYYLEWAKAKGGRTHKGFCVRQS